MAQPSCFGLIHALTVLRSWHINMSSERPTKKARAFSDATVPAVSGEGIHFTPELFARITTFASAIKCPDVMNICLAVGPVVSRTVKHFYLWRNEKYLVDTLKCLRGWQYGLWKARANHRAWMEVNTDWKTTAVSDDSVSGMSRLNLQDIIVIGSHPFVAFNSVAFAVELGLLEVVKFLIEDKGVDPNEYCWTLSSSYRVHPVSAAMACGQKNVFQYLLSLPSTNLYSEIDDNRARIRNHGLFEQALGIYVGDKTEKAYLTSIINHTRFDVNRACHRYSTFPTSNISCLFIALEKLQVLLDKFEMGYRRSGGDNLDLTQDHSESLERHINVVKLLLEAGENPNQIVWEGVGSAIDMVEIWLRELHPNVGYPSIRLLRERVNRQLLAMMREPRAT